MIFKIISLTALWLLALTLTTKLQVPREYLMMCGAATYAIGDYLTTTSKAANDLVEQAIVTMVAHHKSMSRSNTMGADAVARHQVIMDVDGIETYQIDVSKIETIDQPE